MTGRSIQQAVHCLIKRKWTHKNYNLLISLVIALSSTRLLQDILSLNPRATGAPSYNAFHIFIVLHTLFVFIISVSHKWVSSFVPRLHNCAYIFIYIISTFFSLISIHRWVNSNICVVANKWVGFDKCSIFSSLCFFFVSCFFLGYEL